MFGREVADRERRSGAPYEDPTKDFFESVRRQSLLLENLVLGKKSNQQTKKNENKSEFQA